MWELLWHMVVWIVAIMSGILALVREALQIYRPEKIRPRSLFWNCVVIALIISAGILWFIEHQKVVDLTNQKYLKRQEIYKEFGEESTRRINIYRREHKLNEDITFLAHKNDQSRGRLCQAIEPKVRQLEETKKEKDEEDAKFTGLLIKVRQHFEDSSELERLIKEVSVLPVYSMKEPNEADLSDMNSWFNGVSAEREIFIQDRIIKPLGDLAEYLNKNLK